MRRSSRLSPSAWLAMLIALGVSSPSSARADEQSSTATAGDEQRADAIFGAFSPAGRLAHAGHVSLGNTLPLCAALRSRFLTLGSHDGPPAQRSSCLALLSSAVSFGPSCTVASLATWACLTGGPYAR